MIDSRAVGTKPQTGVKHTFKYIYNLLFLPHSQISGRTARRNDHKTLWMSFCVLISLLVSRHQPSALCPARHMAAFDAPLANAVSIPERRRIIWHRQLVF